MIEQEARGEIMHVRQQTSLEYETAMRRMSALVIVIDDSLVMRKILEVCLHRAGYLVKSFPDGIETFRWLATAEARLPALVFVDVCLPRMDGYEIIKRLKAKPALEHTVFVMISQRDGVLDRLKGRLAGAKDSLVKPCRTQVIVATVQRYLGAASLADEGAVDTEELLKGGDGSGLFPLSVGEQSLQQGRKEGRKSEDG